MKVETLGTEEAITALQGEMLQQDRMYGTWGSSSAQVRLAIACMDDEVQEALVEWQRYRATTDWLSVRAEALQVAAVAMRLVRDLEVRL